MHSHMTQQELADALGIAQSQVSRYCRRGMPSDVQGAKLWMSTNVRLTMRSPIYRRQTTTTVKKPAAEPTPAELWELATSIADLLLDCEAEDFEVGLAHLANLIRALPEDIGEALPLPRKVWAALMRLAEG